VDKVVLIISIFFTAMAMRKAGLVRGKHVALITDYVVNVSLPCLSVVTLARLDLKGAHLEVAVIAWGMILAGAGLAYAVGRMTALTDRNLRAFVLLSAFPNTGFLGYPLAYAVFGSSGLSYAIIYDQIGMFPLFLTLGFFVAGGRESLGSALRFPPFIALLAGLIFNVTALPLPQLVATPLTALGWTTLPLTIFLIGAKITFKGNHDFRYIATALTLRMLLLPLMLWLVLQALEMHGLPYQVALMETAMPPALSTSILALKYNLDEELTVSCIGAGTVLCILIFAGFMAMR